MEPITDKEGDNNQEVSADGFRQREIMLSINDEEEKALRDDNISAIRNQTQSGLS